MLLFRGTTLPSAVHHVDASNNNFPMFLLPALYIKNNHLWLILNIVVMPESQKVLLDCIHIYHMKMLFLEVVSLT